MPEGVQQPHHPRGPAAPRRARWTDPPRYPGGPTARRIVRAPSGARTGCAAERACCPRLSREPSRSRISARWASTKALAAKVTLTVSQHLAANLRTPDRATSEIAEAAEEIWLAKSGRCLFPPVTHSGLVGWLEH